MARLSVVATAVCCANLLWVPTASHRISSSWVSSATGSDSVCGHQTGGEATASQRKVSAEAFRIAFRLQQDVIDREGDRARTMVVLRFVRRGSREEPDPGWALYVRGDWPDRTDRFSRVGALRASRLRKAFSPRRQPPGTPK